MIHTHIIFNYNIENLLLKFHLNINLFVLL
jgi:hypothetical protein